MSDLHVRRDLADATAERLTTSIGAVLGDRFVRADGERVDVWNDGIVVRAVDVLERCGRRAARPAEDYVDSVATTQRRVGLIALRHWNARPDLPLPQVVAECFDDDSAWPRGLWEWVRSLDRAGRAAVASGALTWVSGVVRLVGLDPRIRWSDPSSTRRWDVPGRAVALNGGPDATTGRPSDGERLLLVSDGHGGPGDRLRAGFQAVVRTVGLRVAPARVTLAAPSRGTLEQHPVDEALLQIAVDRIVELVAHRAAPQDAAARPGPGCRHCHLLEDCGEGLGLMVGAAGGPAPSTGAREDMP